LSFRSTTNVFATLALAIFLSSCEKEKPKQAAPSASSPPPPPTASAPAPAPSATVAEKKPTIPCPEHSEGKGTFDDPCKAKGKTRIMDVSATTKVGDKGPTFKIVSKSNHEILYGKIVVYFYDKKGKQLDAPDGDKQRRRLTCAGNIFSGPVKPNEKIFMNFSCVKKDNVPKGVAAIEGEIQTVGFPDDSGKIDSYWRNDDLAPEERPKGGIK
jgi:hypothetical protein